MCHEGYDPSLPVSQTGVLPLTLMTRMFAKGFEPTARRPLLYSYQTELYTSYYLKENGLLMLIRIKLAKRVN